MFRAKLPSMAFAVFLKGSGDRERAIPDSKGPLFFCFFSGDQPCWELDASQPLYFGAESFSRSASSKFFPNSYLFEKHEITAQYTVKETVLSQKHSIAWLRVLKKCRR